MKLSIITISFNNKAGLIKTAESVCRQTFRDFEWIIIEGGGSDGSKEMIEELASDATNNISYWCSEKDNGVYNAMNKGLEHVNGEWVNFMNAGDTFFDSNTLAMLFCKERNTDIVYGQMPRRCANGPLNNPSSMKPFLDFCHFYYDTLPHQSTYTRLSLIKRVGRFDERYKLYADWCFFAKAILWYGASYEYIPFPLSIYQGDGISETNDNYAELQKIRKEIYYNHIETMIPGFFYHAFLVKVPYVVEVRKLYLRLKKKWYYK